LAKSRLDFCWCRHAEGVSSTAARLVGSNCEVKRSIDPNQGDVHRPAERRVHRGAAAHHRARRGGKEGEGAPNARRRWHGGCTNTPDAVTETGHVAGHRRRGGRHLRNRLCANTGAVAVSLRDHPQSSRITLGPAVWSGAHLDRRSGPAREKCVGCERTAGHRPGVLHRPRDRVRGGSARATSGHFECAGLVDRRPLSALGLGLWLCPVCEASGFVRTLVTRGRVVRNDFGDPKA
jgi:hypothetical protein